MTRRIGLALLLTPILALTCSCTTTRHLTNSTASGLQQILETEAVDRAVQKLTWPDLTGRTAFVEVASPTDWGNQFYLREAVASALAEHGAILTEDYAHADLVVRALAGSVGTDQKDIFFGMPQVQSVVIPVSLPELALYKSEEQTGFAKTEVVVTDNHRGGEIWHSGPTWGDTFSHTRSVLFIGWYNTDTSRYKK